MSLFDELVNEGYKFENETNKEKYVGRIKEIRIHPKYFHELMVDPRMRQFLHFGEHIRLYGYPLIRDMEVDKWKFII